jgi:hypothetical protein
VTLLNILITEYMNTNLTSKTIQESTSELYEKTDDNVISVGYGFKKVGETFTNEKCLIFGVREKKPLEQISGDQIIPKFLLIGDELIKTDVQERNKIVAMGNCDSSFYTWKSSTPGNQGTIRPLQGGASAINETEFPGNACTLGFLAKDLLDDSTVGISNVHCAASQPFSPAAIPYTGVYAGNDIIQPSEGGDPIGFVKRFVFIYPALTNTVDVAVYSLKDEVLGPDSRYKQYGLAGMTADLPWASSQEISDLLTSDPLLYSSGRTTGPKGGGSVKLRVNEIDAEIEVGYYGDSTVAKFGKCIGFVAAPGSETRPFSTQCHWPIKGGDSGSCLIADIGGVKKVIGLVFAGAQNEDGICIEGYACHIQEVAKMACIASFV